jgi:hypothetical protein
MCIAPSSLPIWSPRINRAYHARQDQGPRLHRSFNRRLLRAYRLYISASRAWAASGGTTWPEYVVAESRFLHYLDDQESRFSRLAGEEASHG